ncbi:hypothetical protein BsWGS_08824 [Bradybaena similaris]
MLASLRRLACNMTDRVVPQIARASFNSFIGSGAAGHKMDTKTQFTAASSGPRSYEAAMKALQNLQSNAEVIAKARQNKSPVHNIPNMIKYIVRSGLTMDDVDKLSVIHVSGTKGKGSTCAFSERILYSRGYKTGLFTSPHMIEVRERIQINGRPISQDLFSKHFWRVYDSLESTQTEVGVSADNGGGMPAYFAFLTVLSLHVFLSEGVDVAVIEVGIGGQFDSTNFFRKPVVCGLTSLGLDHTAILGNTITDIAWNKAGIFKTGRPAITVPHDRTAMEVLLKRAHEIQNPLYLAVEMSKESLERRHIKLGIAGAKQVENASLAVHLCNMWEQNHTPGQRMVQYPPTSASSIEDIPKLDIADLDAATIQGLSSCVWPGRAQTVHSGGVTYYLDGAHTKESMEVCVQWFEETAEKDRKRHGWKKCARILLFNATSDRDVTLLLACLTTCNFDAALFCTNILSVVESQNRADQINRTVTVNHMMEKVDLNKSTWDELITRSRQHSKIAEDLTCLNGGILHGPSANKADHHNHKLTADISITSNGFIFFDQNFKKTDNIATQQANHVIDTEYQREINSIRKCEVSQAEISTSNGQSKNGRTPTTKNTLTNCTQTNGSIYKGIDTTPDVHQDCFAKDRQLLQTTLNGVRHVSNSDCNAVKHQGAVSMKFSCILNALLWATQGKDPSVPASEAEFVAASIPRSLRDADHLQILVTGSLHLVGGVLGVIDPRMND